MSDAVVAAAAADAKKVESAVVVDADAVGKYLKTKWSALVAKVKPYVTHGVAVVGGWLGGSKVVAGVVALWHLL